MLQCTVLSTEGMCIALAWFFWCFKTKPLIYIWFYTGCRIFHDELPDLLEVWTRVVWFFTTKHLIYTWSHTGLFDISQRNTLSNIASYRIFPIFHAEASYLAWFPISLSDISRHGFIKVDLTSGLPLLELYLLFISFLVFSIFSWNGMT